MFLLVSFAAVADEPIRVDCVHVEGTHLVQNPATYLTGHLPGKGGRLEGK